MVDWLKDHAAEQAGKAGEAAADDALRRQRHASFVTMLRDYSRAGERVRSLAARYRTHFDVREGLPERDSAPQRLLLDIAWKHPRSDYRRVPHAEAVEHFAKAPHGTPLREDNLCGGWRWTCDIHFQQPDGTKRRISLEGQQCDVGLLTDLTAKRPKTTVRLPYEEVDVRFSFLRGSYSNVGRRRDDAAFVIHCDPMMSGDEKRRVLLHHLEDRTVGWACRELPESVFDQIVQYVVTGKEVFAPPKRDGFYTRFV